MFEMPEIPAIHLPSTVSILAFTGVIAFVAISFWYGIFRSWNLAAETDGSQADVGEATIRPGWFAIGLLAWLGIGAALPISGVLSFQILPPPGFLFAAGCFFIGVLVAMSRIGKQLATVPMVMLVGFHIFRLPLELILHNWYLAGTIPIQMTYEGLNFDIATGVLALLLTIWMVLADPPSIAVWVFNIVGSVLLFAVVMIAILSVPTPLRQFANDPPLLLPFNFPFSYIVSVAVTGALIGHVVIFRKLLSKPAASGPFITKGADHGQTG